MADARPFLVTDSNGAPLTGAAAGMTVLARDTAGGVRTPPAVTEVGEGIYQVQVSDADETAGTVVLVDTGAGNEPRRVVHTCYKADGSNQFWAACVEDTAGALWAGAAPTIGSYRGKDGSSRTSPAVVAVAGAYLFAVVPTAADITADVEARIDGPAGSAQAYWYGSTEPISPWIAASPAPLLNPAADMAAFLTGKTAGVTALVLGTNLFAGPVRNQDRTPSPSVWLLNTPGAAPSPYLTASRRSQLAPSVQCVVRGPIGDVAGGETLARGVLSWLHQRVVTGYVSWLARESQPTYLGEDSDNHPLFSLNIDAPFDATLG